MRAIFLAIGFCAALIWYLVTYGPGQQLSVDLYLSPYGLDDLSKFISGNGLSSFERQFAAARAAGQETFSYGGKTYTTLRAGEPAPVYVSSHSVPKNNQCIIITDGSDGTFRHELAHCNGWEHPLKNAQYDTPKKYIHKYRGKLIIIQSGRQDRIAQKEAQSGSIFKMTKKPVKKFCDEMWKKQGAVGTVNYPLAGCAVVG